MESTFKSLTANWQKWSPRDFEVWLGLIEDQRFAKYSKKVSQLLLEQDSDDDSESDSNSDEKRLFC